MKKFFTPTFFVALAALMISVSSLSAQELQDSQNEAVSLNGAQDTVAVARTLYNTPNYKFMARECDKKYSTRGKIHIGNDIYYMILNSEYGFITPQPADEGADRQFLIKTNALYWLGTVMNLGFEYRPDKTRTLSVVLNGGFAPLYSKNWKTNLGGWFVSPELRFYLGFQKNMFVGAQYLYTQMDVKINMLGDLGRKGHANGVGAVFGVKLPILKKVDVEVCAAVGGLHCNYDTYTVYPVSYSISSTRYARTPHSSLKEWKFAPLQLALNFGWNLVK
ncbi:MAG: DUF3575 domain-containing protein [Rikenellaceae bacterium]